VEEFEAEVATLAGLAHPNIVQLFGVASPGNAASGGAGTQLFKPSP